MKKFRYIANEKLYSKNERAEAWKKVVDNVDITNLLHEYVKQEQLSSDFENFVKLELPKRCK